MWGTIIFLTLLAAAHLWFIAWSMWVGDHLKHLCISAGLGIAVYGLGFVITTAIKRLRDKARCSFPSMQPQPAARFFSGKVILVVAGTLLAELIAVVFSALLRSAVAMEAAYYGVLVVSGAALGAWCKSARHVPIIASTVILLLVSAAGTLLFLESPGAQFQYGPEITIFAIEGHLARMTMLPADVAVMLSSWRVARALSRRETGVSPPQGSA